MSEPLRGVRVVDVTQYAAGPVATLLLGDYGADVVKVEPVTGDPFRAARAASVAGANPGFVSLNRNKRSVAVDLRTSDGQEIVRRLSTTADVFVENFKPGVADRLNVGYERLRETNPRLVYASISGFGRGGPYRERPSVDVVAQAVAGIMHLTGEEGGEPLMVGTPLGDYLGGIFATMGIVLALLERPESGPGRRVEVNLVDGLLFVLGVRFADLFATGREPPRRGAGHTQIAPGGVLHARDAPFTVAVLGQAAWTALCEVAGSPGLAGDPRFATNGERVRNREALVAELDAVFRTRDRASWLERLAERGIPCAPVNSLRDVLADGALTDIVQHVAYGDVPDLRTIGPPVKLDGERGAQRHDPPVLGADTLDVLLEAGYSRAQVARWHASRIVEAPTTRRAGTTGARSRRS